MGKEENVTQTLSFNKKKKEIVLKPQAQKYNIQCHPHKMQHILSPMDHSVSWILFDFFFLYVISYMLLLPKSN